MCIHIHRKIDNVLNEIKCDIGAVTGSKICDIRIFKEVKTNLGTLPPKPYRYLNM